MLDPKFVRENSQLVKTLIEKRGVKLNWKDFLSLSQKRNEILKKVESLRFEQNKASKEIGWKKQEGENAASVIAEMRKVSDNLKILEEELKVLDEKVHAFLLTVPNIPHESVPEGKDEEDNEEVRRFGRPPDFSFSPKPHWDIGADLGILDFERASKIAGARFVIYYGAGALLERALINFMLDVHTREKGYREVIPPYVANEESLTGTGNLPKFEDDLFKLRGYSWYMIPTAEVPLTNLFRDEILEGEKLPARFAAYTPCFRQEAGSYGKDVRGLIRLHQFNKVELMTFSTPESSYDELEKLTADAEDILRRLDLHYRVVALCTGDLGFAGAKTYDLEIWMPHRRKFVEISSCTNCEDFQARRAGIRYRPGPMEKPEYVHTLNGSGVAAGRTVSAILENYQQEDGSVLVPEVLQPYMNGLERISVP
ncbi:MAG: serine--tRNA ligase [Candidatus Aminicenantes bacterium]|nr:serine--tRNA ligase [Candidatus Aminicenantes bacterium]